MKSHFLENTGWKEQGSERGAERGFSVALESSSESGRTFSLVELETEPGPAEHQARAHHCCPSEFSNESFLGLYVIVPFPTPSSLPPCPFSNCDSVLSVALLFFPKSGQWHFYYYGFVIRFNI